MAASPGMFVSGAATSADGSSTHSFRVISELSNTITGYLHPACSVTRYFILFSRAHPKSATIARSTLHLALNFGRELLQNGLCSVLIVLNSGSAVPAVICHANVDVLRQIALNAFA